MYPGSHWTIMTHMIYNIYIYIYIKQQTLGSVADTYGKQSGAVRIVGFFVHLWKIQITSSFFPPKFMIYGGE